jgi:hypothetical protein
MALCVLVRVVAAMLFLDKSLIGNLITAIGKPISMMRTGLL